jgi:hypothetical protein
MNRLALLLKKADGGDGAGSGGGALPTTLGGPPGGGASPAEAPVHHPPGFSPAGRPAVEVASLEAQRGGGGARGTDVAGDVAAQLRDRKAKKRARAASALEGEYVPLDPSDWRAKAVAKAV